MMNGCCLDTNVNSLFTLKYKQQLFSFCFIGRNTPTSNVSKLSIRNNYHHLQHVKQKRPYSVSGTLAITPAPATVRLACPLIFLSQERCFSSNTTTTLILTLRVIVFKFRNSISLNLRCDQSEPLFCFQQFALSISFSEDFRVAETQETPPQTSHRCYHQHTERRV